MVSGVVLWSIGRQEVIVTLEAYSFTVSVGRDYLEHLVLSSIFNTTLHRRLSVNPVGSRLIYIKEFYI
jgi:hypothetical protein